MKILIADDEKNVREALAEMIRLFAVNMEIVACADSVATAIEGINKYQPDVVLLDIDLVDGSGFDVLKYYQNPTFKVIFITAFQEYAIEAFRFSAMDYLLKPVDPKLLENALMKVESSAEKDKISLKVASFMHNMDTLSRNAKKVILKTSDSVYVVNVKDIMFCEADRTYTTFFLSDKSKIVVSRALGEFDELFSSYGFLRIHQSFLLNIDFVKRYDKGSGGTVVLTDNTSLPVATRKKDLLLQFLSKL